MFSPKRITRVATLLTSWPPPQLHSSLREQGTWLRSALIMQGKSQAFRPPALGFGPTKLIWSNHHPLPGPVSPFGFFIFFIFIYFFFNFFLTFYLFLRQGETEHEQVRVREGETQNLKQAPGSELSAQSPTRSSNSRTVRS